jgi:hypothetical protein
MFRRTQCLNIQPSSSPREPSQIPGPLIQRQSVAFHETWIQINVFYIAFGWSPTDERFITVQFVLNRLMSRNAYLAISRNFFYKIMADRRIYESHYKPSVEWRTQEAGIAQSVQWLGYGLKDRRIMVRHRTGSRDLAVLQNAQSGCEAHPASCPMVTGRLEAKCKVVTVHAVKGCCRSTETAELFPNLSIKWRRMVNITPRPF